MKLTTLGYALIGLVQAEPCSGYALRRVFETTPMGTYSSSPGSIYPALARLVAAGFLEKRAPAGGGKKLFHVTTRGRDAMNAWLRTPVTEEEVTRSVDLVLLRFAFLENVDEPGVTQSFLASFESALSNRIEQIEAYLESPAGRALGRHGRLAVENGLQGLMTQRQWAATSKKEFRS
ncbi:PadR family transcriptional regulator [Hyphobacterium sp. HN65]|uniref:PadR family transcriptional regulator n=1 Tax=Hyphobacterium lacteum TaxID=3116575 RepID=A0ABU7LSI1_9PROT|nr:PadR family transcriptional regulator [Hyphobacterium sp. HN65]MEE2526852.1 PadR family transcriptional regulator [Hyphobacterium sp. HN65]